MPNAGETQSGRGNQAYFRQLTDTRDILELYTLKSSQQLLHREGDRSGRLLAWILRRKLLRTLVLHLTNPQGGEARTHHDIVTVFRDHLERVYANPVNPD
ncbi:hypothetical protein NDU88_000924 [Pleurodeles waltl]|uniref:Uncharacterized protein n=1 Tax=Pleurodeles waltl TaxID=8319 RepID=A0AAV7NHJ9_PLEWA|nr:hypothetical protein NDU88_000924 [Pleurodeles waltl]